MQKENYKLQKEDGYYYLMQEGNDIAIATTDQSFIDELGAMKLSKQNCDKVFGVVDVGALALEECNNTDPLRLDSQKYKQDPYFRIGYLKGFNKAMELNKDKLFTVEDIKTTIDKAKQGHIEETYVGYGRPTHPTFVLDDLSYDEIIQSLQQPTEIEVEIEMDICGDKVYEVPEMLLDENGCLILKKK